MRCQFMAISISCRVKGCTTVATFIYPFLLRRGFGGASMGGGKLSGGLKYGGRGRGFGSNDGITETG